MSRTDARTPTSSIVAAAAAGTLAYAACTQQAFAGLAPRGVGAAPQLQAAAASLAGPASSGLTSSASAAVGLLAAGAATAGARSRTTRRAVEVKKKGVRVVDGKEIPWNLFSPKAPYKGSTISKETITTQSKLVNWETTHVVMRHDKNLPYLEGQSIGVIAPGPDKKGEVPAKIRLYSIASSTPGDDETYETVSLVVKRVVEVEGKGWCEYSNVALPDKEFPEATKVYRGVCSTHICDLKAGDEVLLTGPTGAEMLLPEDPTSNIIMLATGTGIAPFRSFLRHLFHDKGSAGKFKGLAWMFLGVPFSASLLYDEEWKKMKAEYPDQFRYDYAISDEMKNKEGKSMYVQHKVMEFTEDLWPMMKLTKTHVYMCGLKGMESGLQEAFGPLAEKDGLVWPEFVKQMKKDGRYHCEVY